jgi:DNA processing protein
MLPDSAYLHTLRLVPGFGSVHLRRARERYGSFAAIWETAPERLRDLPRFPTATVTAFGAATRSLDVTTEWEKLLALGITILTEDEEDFPPLLREAADHPLALYTRGERALLGHPRPIAVVGSRKATGYGKRATEALVAALGRSGFAIVSGLAFGIDAVAHRSALLASIPTIAVLGSGLDDAHITPTSHLPLATDILARGGLLVSEYPPGSEASVGTFPARNRIMAGMSLGVLVAEAAEKSGSLITARLALDYGRDVFAVPGSIFAESAAGCHALIKEGARLVTGVGDVLAEYPGMARERSAPDSDTKNTEVPLPPDQELILRLLGDESLHIDALVERSRLPGPTVSIALTTLELAGLVKNIGGMHYIKM